MRESGLCKRDEEGDEDGDVDEDDHRSGGSLTRLRRIYNFLLFHANIIQLSHIFGNFYMIYWTNLLIQCPVPVPVCCMFFLQKKSISNEVQMQ